MNGRFERLAKWAIRGRRWMRPLGQVLAVAALAYVVWVVAHTFSLDLFIDALRRQPLLLLATVLWATVSMGLVGIGWLLILQGIIGRRVDPTALLAVHFKTQFYKYLPSNTVHFLGRHWYLTIIGCRQRDGGLLLAAEVLLLVGSSAALSVPLLWLAAVRPSLEATLGVGPDLVAEAVIMAAVVYGAAVLLVLRRLSQPQERGGKRLVAGAVFVFLSQAANAVHFYACIAVLAPDAGISLWGAGALFAASWLAGYLLPGLSAGIGVREATLLSLLGLAGLSGPAAEIVTLSRLAWIVSDITTYCAAIVLWRPLKVEERIGNPSRRS